MICPRCQTQNVELATFCMQCGQPLTQPLQPGQIAASPIGLGTPSTSPIPGEHDQPPPYVGVSVPPPELPTPAYQTDEPSSRRRVGDNRRPRAAGIGGILLLVVLAALIVLALVGRPLLPLLQTSSTQQAVSTTQATAPNGKATAPSPIITPASASTIVYQNTLLAPAAEWEPDQACFFASDGFHIKPNLACQSPVRGLTDVDVSVQMRQISGGPTDQNGIEVRRSGDPASLYEFDIDANGGWLFKKCIRSFDNCDTLESGSDHAIRVGVGAVNMLEIRAVGSRFSLLVNGTQVSQVFDASLASGDVWLDTGGHAECVFTYFTASRPT